MRVESVLYHARGLRAGSSDVTDAPDVSKAIPSPVRSTGSNTCGASTKTASYMTNQVTTASGLKLTELKVLADALPKRGQLTGPYHSDG